MLLQCYGSSIFSREPEMGAVPTATVTIECNRVRVDFTGLVGELDNRWDFGDNTTGQGLNVSHYYKDVNFKTLKWKHRISPFMPWTEYEFPSKAIFIGDGCGSLTNISDLITKKVLPVGSLSEQDIYVFGNLNINTAYQFNSCNFYVLPGSVVRVADTYKLTLNGGSMQPHAPQSCEQALWNGLEAFGKSELVTNGLTINNALYGIHPIMNGSVRRSPSLSISSTTFNNNFIGICANSGTFTLNSFSGNTFNGGEILYNVKFCSGGSLPAGIPYWRRSYAGILADGTSGTRLLMPTGATGNNFYNLSAGIVCLDAESNIEGCNFFNIFLSYLENKMSLNMHGSAIIANLSTPLRVFRVKDANVSYADRGIFVNASGTNTTVGIYSCIISDVQNGIEVNNTGIGLDCQVTHNSVSCTRYIQNALKHKPTATGILLTDNGTPLNIFIGFNWYINMHIASSLSELAQPKGIHVVSMTPPVETPIQSYIWDNAINLSTNGDGIKMENAVNYAIGYNPILLSTPQGDAQGIYISGGRDNKVGCNDFSGQNFSFTTGIFSDGSQNIHVNGNVFYKPVFGLHIKNYHNSSCLIGDNTFTALPPNPFQTDGVGAGMIYNQTITGPQYKTANKWEGDYFDGAYFAGSSGLNSYCQSQYTVTSQANVGPGTLNPVRTDYTNDPFCAAWFLFDNNGGETAPGCLSVVAPPTTANETDLKLASAEMAGLSNGNAWAAETGLYDKFAGSNSIGAPQVIQNFVQQRTNQSAGQMYQTRRNLAAIQSPSVSVWNTLKGLKESKKVLLDNVVQTQSTDIFDNMATKYESLEALDAQFITAYTPEAGRLALTAQNLQTISDAINCTTQPCLYEQWVYSRYTTVVLRKERDLTEGEAAQLRNLALLCPEEAGPAVYLARSWHFLRTGESINDPCAFQIYQKIQERSTEKEYKAAPVNLDVQPNPATEEAIVSFPVTSGNMQLTLTDALGRVIAQKPIVEGSVKTSLYVSNIPGGLYIVRLHHADGSMMTQTKLIVTH